MKLNTGVANYRRSGIKPSFMSGKGSFGMKQVPFDPANGEGSNELLYTL